MVHATEHVAAAAIQIAQLRVAPVWRRRTLIERVLEQHEAMHTTIARALAHQHQLAGRGLAEELVKIVASAERSLLESEADGDAPVASFGSWPMLLRDTASREITQLHTGGLLLRAC